MCIKAKPRAQEESKYTNITSRAFLLAQTFLSQEVSFESASNAMRKLGPYRYIN